MFAMMAAMGGMDMPQGAPPVRLVRDRRWGQPIPRGLSVYEQTVGKEGEQVKFMVAALNPTNAGRKFDKLFNDLAKLHREKGDTVTDDDIKITKRKYFKYFEYEHVLQSKS